MTHFIDKDPRGLTFALPGTTWAHIQKHLIELSGSFREVFTTLQSPDLILDNLPTPTGPPRSGQERYVRFSPALNTHIIVPTKTLTQPQDAPGYGTIQAGTRLAISAMTNPTVPRGTIVWKKPPP